MVLKDAKALGLNEIHEKEDIPVDLSAENKEYKFSFDGKY